MNFKEKMKRRAGFTLVELCISMVVVAIIVTMACSFLPLLFNRSSRVSDMTAVAEDVMNLENSVNNFILHYDNNDFGFGFTSNGLYAYKKGGDIVNDRVGEVTFNKEEHIISSKSYLSGEDNWGSSALLGNITSVTFSKADSTGNADEISAKNILIKCSLEYEDVNNETKLFDIVFVTHAQGEVVRRVDK